MKEKFDLSSYSKYEVARIIGARALQISYNAPVLIKMDKEKMASLSFDPIKIAELEFREGVLPITVRRPVPKKIEQRIKKGREIIKEEDEEKPKKEMKSETTLEVPEEVETLAQAEIIEAGESQTEEELIDEIEKEEPEIESEEI